MSDTKKVTGSSQQYSERYSAIRRDAESKWPEWKVSTYNASVAVSAHAKKIVK